MISNKIAVAIFLIIFMKTVASTLSTIQGPNPSSKHVLQMRGLSTVFKQKRKAVLLDTNSIVNPIGIKRVKGQDREHGARRTVPKLLNRINIVKTTGSIGKNTEGMDISQGKLVPRVNKFEKLISQRRYNEIFEHGNDMEPEEFLKQLCPVVETLEQYDGIVNHLKSRKMVALFYVHGNMGIVEGAMTIESKLYNSVNYVDKGDLETALPLALEKERYDRVVGLLNIRRGITAEDDKQLKREGKPTRFEWFVSDFLYNLASQENYDMTLRRFLTFHGVELRDKHPDILDTLCQELVNHLKNWFDEPKAKNLLVDLIGQPVLLTSMSFAKGFLYGADDKVLSNFIKYAWNGAIREGLTRESRWGGERLWRVVKGERPNQIIGNYPLSKEVLVDDLDHFPTKQRLEDRWAKKNAVIIYNKLTRLGSTFDVLLNVLWNIVSEYAVSLIDVKPLVISTK